MRAFASPDAFSACTRIGTFVASVIAARLMHVLQQAIASLLRKGRKMMQLERIRAMEAEKKTIMGERVRTCTICLDTKVDVHDGLTCPHGKSFICCQCFQEEVRIQASNLSMFNQNDQSIQCRVCTDSASRLETVYYSLQSIALHLPTVAFAEFMQMRDDARVGIALSRQEATYAAKLGNIQNSDTLAQSVVEIVNEILTDKCPRLDCRRAFFDFDGCFALTCAACGCNFCAYCMQECHGDSHDHVLNCGQNTSKRRGLFAHMNVFLQSQKIRREASLRVLMTRCMSALKTAKVILQAVDIDGDQLWQSCDMSHPTVKRIYVQWADVEEQDVVEA